jgi:hypothetical protein
MIDYTPRKKIESYPKFANRQVKVTIDPPVKPSYTPRTTKNFPSKVTQGGSTAKRDVISYTGSKMIGVTILHKSCLQPVFSQEDAIDAAHMRR